MEKQDVYIETTDSPSFKIIPGNIALSGDRAYLRGFRVECYINIPRPEGAFQEVCSIPGHTDWKGIQKNIDVTREEFIRLLKRVFEKGLRPPLNY